MANSRKVKVERKTSETDIVLTLNIDGEGKSNIATGCGFLDHMLTLFAKHSKVDLDIKCKGDTYVDYHHSAEDVGICLGMAFNKALGDMRGIERYGDSIIPMDETLILCAVDISMRAHLTFSARFPTQKIGDFDSELVQEFFEAFIRNAQWTMHIKKLSGTNSHHIAEGIFKAFAHTTKKAVSIDEKYSNQILSTKGVL